MISLTPQQVEQAEEAAPVALKALGTQAGLVTLSVVPVDGIYALTSTPFEVIGNPEPYESLGAAIQRMLACAEAVANDDFPPARDEQVAA